MRRADAVAVGSGVMEAATPEPQLLVRPALAHDVEPLGEMPGSGFADRQWLARRGQRLFQLPELCYRVLQEVDGQRTPEEIAARLTATTEWLVTPAHVRHILQTKLLALGLLATPPGARGPDARVRGRSPLQVSWGRLVAGPRAADAMARLFQGLYAPPLVVVLLAVSGPRLRMVLCRAWSRRDPPRRPVHAGWTARDADSDRRGRGLP